MTNTPNAVTGSGDQAPDPAAVVPDGPLMPWLHITADARVIHADGTED